MKIFISTDMEGIASFTNWKELEKKSNFYQETRDEITKEVNAAIEGVLDTNEDIETIVVCDSHGQGDSIIPAALHDKAELIRGFPRPIYMMETISEGFDILFLVGYHSKIGTPNSIMDHSYSGSIIYELKLNDIAMGEVQLNAGLAAAYDTPLGLVVGDDKLAQNMANDYGEAVQTVITKYGISRFAAKCRHPKKVHEDIREKARIAVEKVEQLPLRKYGTPLECEMKLNATMHADLIELMPTIERLDGRTIRFQAEDYPALYRTVIAIIIIGAQAKVV